MKNIFHLTTAFDTVGTMGKTALDVALTCDVLAPRKDSPSLTSIATSVKLDDVSVGFVDIEKWRLPKNKQADDPRCFEQTVSLCKTTITVL